MARTDPLQLLLDRLKGVKRCGDGWQAKCPAHDDDNPSLTIKQGDRQPIVLYCHAGCKPENILKKIGLEMADICRDERLEYETSCNENNIETTYDYCDKNGLRFQVVRLPGKEFFLRRPNGNGG